MEKIVELSIEDFQKMIQEIKELKHENNELKKAVAYLNGQISDYNQKFSKDGTI